MPTAQPQQTTLTIEVLSIAMVRSVIARLRAKAFGDADKVADELEQAIARHPKE